ncbi:class III extradiol dioxygenase subunit B-like domain-containing protein [Streptomyces sp. NPDC006879]|uniref:class III extradiol dioxygenase subunit B-like domain-containing protein n=1 Tax=Streptomyces sp. NPDC006879 TaxID=3364767 RepID=UPI0036D1A321
MLVAAAVCPCPPLLVPQLAAGAAAELDALRVACSDAVAVLAASRPDLLVVLGPARGPERPGVYPEGTGGSFQGFGVDLSVRLGQPFAARAEPAQELPASLAVAAWLLGRCAWTAAPVEGLALGEELAEDCFRAGRDLAARAGRVALLVMGDGSACRTLKAPGYLDVRAAQFDEGLARALGTADVRALAEIDVATARELQVAGRAPWQALAGAAEGAGLDGRLLRAEAPYGVGYFVGTWS